MLVINNLFRLLYVETRSKIKFQLILRKWFTRWIENISTELNIIDYDALSTRRTQSASSFISYHAAQFNVLKLLFCFSLRPNYVKQSSCNSNEHFCPKFTLEHVSIMKLHFSLLDGNCRPFDSNLTFYVMRPHKLLCIYKKL